VLVTQAEFARLAGVSRSAIRQAINSKLITALSLQNGKTYIEKTEGLQQYQKNSRRQKTAQKAKPLQNPTPNGLDLLGWGQSAPPENKEPPQQSPAASKPAVAITSDVVADCKDTQIPGLIPPAASFFFRLIARLLIIISHLSSRKHTFLL